MDPRFSVMLSRSIAASGLHSSQVADYVGVHKSTVCRWEAGETLPSPGRLVKLSLILRWTEDESATAASLIAGLPPPRRAIDAA